MSSIDKLEVAKVVTIALSWAILAYVLFLDL